MIALGLTGSVGMGKSVLLHLFAAYPGVAVHDSDAVVHSLYGPGGEGAHRVGAEFAGVGNAETGIDRAALRAIVFADRARRARLEALIHPLLLAERHAFFFRALRDAIWLAVVDFPLLFETSSQDVFDAIAVASAPPSVQRARVVSRPGMTDADFRAMDAAQMADSEKRRRADFVIDTGGDMAWSRDQIASLIAILGGSPPLPRSPA